jgi:hypothetical protein
MKKLFPLVITLLISAHCFAQEDIPFPFQGGNKVMTQFFQDSIKLSQRIILSKASGTVVFKFSADEHGDMKNLVIYYADDAVLASPLIDAMKKTTHKWIIPEKEKLHDFIIPFLVRFKATDDDNTETTGAMHNFEVKRKPIVARDQIPLNQATLLPAITISYDAGK